MEIFSTNLGYDIHNTQSIHTSIQNTLNITFKDLDLLEG